LETLKIISDYVDMRARYVALKKQYDASSSALVLLILYRLQFIFTTCMFVCLL